MELPWWRIWISTGWLVLPCSLPPPLLAVAPGAYAIEPQFSSLLARKHVSSPKWSSRLKRKEKCRAFPKELKRNPLKSRISSGKSFISSPFLKCLWSKTWVCLCSWFIFPENETFTRRSKISYQIENLGRGDEPVQFKGKKIQHNKGRLNLFLWSDCDSTEFVGFYGMFIF